MVVVQNLLYKGGSKSLENFTQWQKCNQIKAI